MTRIRELNLDVSSINLTIGQFARKILDLFLADGCSELMTFRDHSQQEFLDHLDSIIINCSRITGLLKILVGDSRGWEEFLAAYGEHLKKRAQYELQAKRIYRFRQEPTDLEHDTIVRLGQNHCRHLRVFRGSSGFKSYLNRILETIALDWLKREGVSKATSNNGNGKERSLPVISFWIGSEKIEIVPGSSDVFYEEYISELVRPDVLLDLKQREKMVLDALDATGKCASVLRLKYEYKDIKYREIAKILGMPPGTVATWFDRGKAKLVEIIPKRYKDLRKSINDARCKCIVENVNKIRQIKPKSSGRDFFERKKERSASITS